MGYSSFFVMLQSRFSKRRLATRLGPGHASLGVLRKLTHSVIRPKCRPALKRSAWRDARYRASRQALITIVGDVGGRVDLADHFPIFLKRDRNELGFAGFAELLSEGRSFPR